MKRTTAVHIDGKQLKHLRIALIYKKKQHLLVAIFKPRVL